MLRIIIYEVYNFLDRKKISYRYRETPRYYSIYIIDLNQLSLLFLFKITRQKLFFIFTKCFYFFLFYITLSLNLPRSLWFDLSTLRIILLRSPALGSEKANLEPLRRSCYVIKGNLWEQSTTGGNSFISNFIPLFSLIFFLNFSVFILLCIHCCNQERHIRKFWDLLW